MVYVNKEQEKHAVEMIIEKNINRIAARRLKKLLIDRYETAPSDRIMNKILRGIPGVVQDDTCKKTKTYDIDLDSVKEYYQMQIDRIEDGI